MLAGKESINDEDIFSRWFFGICQLVRKGQIIPYTDGGETFPGKQEFLA